MIISRKCSIAAILTKWALFSTDVATAEKLAVSLSPANPAFVFPVQKDIPINGRTSSVGG
jgi:hypothetical protein